MKLNNFIKNVYGPKFYHHTILMFLLAFGTASAQFIVTYYLGLIIDAVSMGYKETMSYFWVIISALFLFIICSAILSFFNGKMTIRLSYRLQNKIGEKICSAQYQDIEQIKDGELLSIATKDVEGIKNWLAILLKIGCLPAQLGLAAFFLFRLNWKFSLLTIGLMPLAAVPEIIIAKKLGVYQAKEKKVYASVLSFFTAAIELLLVVKSFRIENLFCQKNDTELQNYKKARMKRLLREQLVEVYGRCYGHITNPLLLFLGAYFIIAGEMSLGMLTSVIFLASFVGEGLKVLCEVPVRLQGGRASAAHIETLLQMRDEQEDEGEACPVSMQKCSPIYEVRALNFMYGKKEVLKNIDFKIWAGEKIAIIGASGCGKTTLFKLLSGLYCPEKGHIFFRGEDLAKAAPEYIRENIAVTTQETFLFHASFKDNFKVSDPDRHDEEVIMAAKKAQIGEFIKTFEQGYEAVVNTTVQTISNGQMQRINLARAFLKNSEIYLLDEPTSALDSCTAKLILDYLFTGYMDKTILVILHNLQEIFRFDKVLMLDEGKVAGFGTHEELMSSCKPYRQLYMQGTANEQEGEL